MRLRLALFLMAPLLAHADLTHLIERPTIAALAQEVSGVAARRNLDEITLYHRTRASSQFRQAADNVLAQLKAYGFDNARIRTYPADGKTMFGTQKSRPAWDVEFAELWELDSGGRPIITYCGTGCEVSLELAAELIYAGQQRVAVYTGGFPEWRDSGNPVELGRGAE